MVLTTIFEFVQSQKAFSKRNFASNSFSLLNCGWSCLKKTSKWIMMKWRSLKAYWGFPCGHSEANNIFFGTSYIIHRLVTRQNSMFNTYRLLTCQNPMLNPYSLLACQNPMLITYRLLTCRNTILNTYGLLTCENTMFDLYRWVIPCETYKSHPRDPLRNQWNFHRLCNSIFQELCVFWFFSIPPG